MPKYQSKCPQHTELDIYQGCSFNCIYCISHHEKKSHSFNIEAITSKINESQADKSPYYLSPWTDAYQHQEAEQKYARHIISALSAKNQAFFVITKSLLVERDLEFFRNKENAFIAISLNCLNDEISSIFEPDAPSATNRKELIQNLVADKSLNVVVKIDPIIPGITDSTELDHLLNWLAEIKPTAVTAETLRLSKAIVENMNEYIDNSKINRILQYYPELELQAKHPNMDYRLEVLNTVAERLKRAGVKAAFCSASLPYKITECDCRGGYNYDF